MLTLSRCKTFRRKYNLPLKKRGALTRVFPFFCFTAFNFGKLLASENGAEKLRARALLEAALPLIARLILPDRDYEPCCRARRCCASLINLREGTAIKVAAGWANDADILIGFFSPSPSPPPPYLSRWPCSLLLPEHVLVFSSPVAKFMSPPDRKTRTMTNHPLPSARILPSYKSLHIFFFPRPIRPTRIGAWIVKTRQIPIDRSIDHHVIYRLTRAK